MSSQSPEHLQQVAAQAVELAKTSGADAADVVVFNSRSSSVSVRGGETQDINSAESLGLGLRVLTGRSQAIVSTSRLETEDLTLLAERAVAMARLAPEDPNAGLASGDQICSEFPDLDLADEADPTTDELLALAKRADSAGLAVEGVSASNGAGASAGRSFIALAASNGFAGHYERTSYGISTSMIGGAGTEMENDYEYNSVVHLSDMMEPETVGRTAGERVMRRLGPRKVASQAVPIVYEQRIASSLVGHLAGAINGSSVARRSSFLQEQMGEAVFGRGISIIDDGHKRRGHSSRPFDAEGISTGELAVIEDGLLKTWLLDLRSARQLGLETTGHAARGTGGPPSPRQSNLNMMPGKVSPEDLMADIEQGFFVCELIGQGVNITTGDYSRGAAGFWIENGEITYPVSEVTIAGNLKDMFANLTPANDLIERGSINAPTCRIEGMTLAGI